MVNAMLILGTPKLQIATHTVFVFVFAYLVADGELQLLHHCQTTASKCYALPRPEIIFH